MERDNRDERLVSHVSGLPTGFLSNRGVFQRARRSDTLDVHTPGDPLMGLGFSVPEKDP